MKLFLAQRVLSFKMKTRLTVMNMHSKLLNNHSVHPPLSARGGGWGEPPTKFSTEGGVWQGLNFWRGFAGKEGVTLFRGGCNFYIKINQNLKYLMAKKGYEQKNISLS